MVSRRTKVAVLFGGRSTEHAVSCLSAGSVLAALDRRRYDVLPVGITPQGRWVLVPDDPAALAAAPGELPGVTDGPAVVLPGDPTVAGLLPLEGGLDVLAPVDVVFPLLHGPFGEDGTVQGLLELAGIPYVGSGVLASAAAMDKTVARTLLTAAGLPVTPAVAVRRSQWDRDPDEVRRQVADLGLPVFVKPARGGSSIGISRVSSLEDLPAGIAAALRCDPKVLVEAAVTGREVECGVLDSPDGPEPSLPAEIRLAPGYEFYDFQAKYLEAATELICPAELPAGVGEQLREVARAAFVALDCAGLARVDFFVGADGRLTVNEVNTLPGFTPTSMFPLMWAATGVCYPALVDRLVQDALRRGTGLH